MVAGRAVAIVAAVIMVAMAVVAVEGIAANGTDAAADERSGQRVAVESGGEPCPGHRADSGSGEHALFTRAAGGKAKAEQAEGRRARGGLKKTHFYIFTWKFYFLATPSVAVDVPFRQRTPVFWCTQVRRLKRVVPKRKTKLSSFRCKCLNRCFLYASTHKEIIYI